MDGDTIDSKSLNEIVQLLTKISNTLDIMSYPMTKDVLQSTLDSDDKRKVYNLLDGIRTIANIQSETGVNSRFISEWGQEWEKIKIVESVGNRRRKLFELSDFDVT